jgi:ATP-binding cassette subfamily B protein
MFKRLLACVREFKLPTILTLIFITGEVVIEVFIPFITANLVNRIEAGAALGEIVRIGLLLLLMALLSLTCGGVAGLTCAKASAGFSKNLRGDLFRKIQTYSFENIDKFSSSSLVTRMTTDVTNVQMSFMMLIRIAVRAPLMLIFSIIMAFIMGGALATSFVVLIPFLVFGLLMVARFAMPAFKRVFKKYDRLNESIEENVRGMRVVKGFSREEYEKEKFGTAADNIRRDFTRAERLVALNNPFMQICVYCNMLFVLTIGSKMIIESGGKLINVGEISAMLTYGMQILMQLMMLAMIYVTLTISSESMKRIYEVLGELDSGQLKVNGLDRLLRYPEFADSEGLGELLGAFEQKDAILDLVTETEGDGVSVVIGSESSVKVINNSTIVFKPIKNKGRTVGAIGVIGPLRMDYARVLATLDSLGGNVTQLLTEPKHSDKGEDQNG